MRRNVLRLSLALGVVLFAVVIWRTGPRQIGADIARLSAFQILVLFGLRAAYWVLRTYNWKQVYECFGPTCPFPRLFGARIADNAVAFLTPSAMLGGLPIRALMLGGADQGRVLASVVLDKTIEILTLAGYSVLAMLASILILPMAPAARWTFGLFIVLATALCLALVATQRRGFFLGVLDPLSRIGIRPKWAIKNRDRIRVVDEAMAGFYRDHRPRIPAVAALYSLSLLLWAVEIDVTLRFLGAPNLTLLKSLLVVSLGNVAFLLPAVPGSLGVYEVTNVGVFAVLGWPAGLAVALSVIRRLLALAWTAAGLLALYWRQRKTKVPAAQTG